MKKLILAGFSALEITSDRKITNSDGKLIVAKKGIVTLVASEDADGITKGQKHNFNLDELMNQENGNWTDIATGETVPAAKKELTEEEKEIASQKTALKNAMDAERAKLMDINFTGDLVTQRDIYHSAVTAYEDFVKANRKTRASAPARVFTEEEQAAIAAYETGKSSLNDARKAVEEAKIALVELRKALPTDFKSGSTGENPAKGKKVGYDTAQTIRKEYAVGRYGNKGEAETVSAIAARHGVSQSAVNYYVNYLQQKLKDGDDVFTPLVNEFYPAEWVDGDGKKQSGAPLRSAGVKEREDKYKVYKAS